eukprot:s587_g17.t1
MERANSEPPKSSGDVVVNPFWSQRAQQDAVLRASRPLGLPEQSPALSAEPLHDDRDAGLCIGKGRGGGLAFGKPNSFETPPSKTDVLQGERVCPKKTEGRMPGDDDLSLGKTTEGRKNPTVADPHMELQRALEAEVVNHLRVQNSQLMEELDRLRSMMSQTGNGSNSSWSEVGGASACAGIPPGSGSDGASACAGIPPEPGSDGGHRRGGYHTPRSSQRSEKGKEQDVRFTPNGTRIPDGTPPTSGNSATCPMPPPPPEKPVVVPPFPPSFLPDVNMENVLDGYEKVESKTKFLKTDCTWEPSREMSPHEARAFWLEREVASLKTSLAKISEGNSFQGSEYWSKGFHPPTGPPVMIADRPATSISTDLGDHRHQGRACAGTLSSELGTRGLPDRASTLSNDHGAQGLQGRACTGCAGPGPLQGHLLANGAADHLHDRACAFSSAHTECHGGAVPHQARALHGMAGSNGLLDTGPACFKDLPRPGVGGGGMGDGSMDRMYGPWTGPEGGSMNTKMELPDLPANSSPLQFGDWLHLATPSMKDISGVAGWWWESTLREAKVYYETWKGSTPLQRIQICPKLPDDLREHRFQRTEQRGVQMLLKAIPLAEQQELVTDRALSSTAILYKLMVRFQPGGAGEKQILLQQLTAMPKVSSAPEVAAAVRNWRRHFGRAQEVQAVLPDGVLLVKALDEPLQKIAALDQQAAFRLSQSRMQLGLDEKPEHGSLWAFSQCLLAEAETLCLMATAPKLESQTPLKLKPLDATSFNGPKKSPSDGAASNGKGKGASMSETPCKWFRSDSGCRAGQKCKWSHSWEGITDKSSRCWICGSKEHRKQDCQVNEMAVSANVSTNGDGGGVEQHAGDQGRSGGDAGTGGDHSTKLDKTSELLHEATQLMKTLRVQPGKPKISVLQLSSIDRSEGNMALIDSGATHGLRPAADVSEWNAAEPTTVQLASGSTSDFRLKRGTRILLSHPEGDTALIVPMSALDELDYKLEWSGGSCRIQDDEGRALTVTVINGCPMIESAQGHQLLQWLELYQLHQRRKLAMVKTLLTSPEELDKNQMNLELALTARLRQQFPQLPDDVMMRLVPYMEMLQSENMGNKLPWNRRKRRRLQRAKHVVIHVFSGADHSFWDRQCSSSSTEVLCIDLEGANPANLLDKHIYAFVLSLCATGKVRAILGGPPCRTLTALRYQQDNGPGVLRTEEYPYGLPSPSPTDAALVLNDTILMFRFWSMFILAEEVRDIHMPPTQFYMEQPEDPARYRRAEDVERYGYFSIFRTAEWKQFAETFNINLVHFDQHPMGHDKRKPTSLATNVAEMYQLSEIRGGPQNEAAVNDQFRALPMAERCEVTKKWASWAPGLKLAIATAVRQHLQVMTQELPTHGWDVVHPDSDGQHASVRPLEQGRKLQEHSSVQSLSSSTGLENQGQPSSLPQFEHGLTAQEHFSVPQLSSSTGVEMKGQPSSLPPLPQGLTTREHYLVQQLSTATNTAGYDVDGQHDSLRSLQEGRETPEHFSEQPLEPSSVQPSDSSAVSAASAGSASSPHQVRRREPHMHALGAVALEQWRRHYLNDHLPARRDCAQCVRAQARSKPHRRIEHPESFTLSVDLSGKLSPGDDQHCKDCKYLLVGCYTYPITKDGKSLVPIPGHEDSEEDQPLPDLDADLDDAADHPNPDGEEAVLPEEEEVAEDDDGPDVKAAKSMHDTWHKLVKESKNVAVKQLTFVEPVKSRNVKYVLPAISRIHSRLRSLGLPLYRLHSDRAKEFCAAPIKAWALERSILTTMTSGSTYKANGRVEGEMNVVKKAIRTLITAGAALLPQWPLAARHIGERRLRSQLHQLGWPVGKLLRFGATAFALRKSWQERYAPWRDIREEVTVLGPDIHASLTNTAYFVKSKTTGRHFFTDDVVVAELPSPAVEEQILYLPERSEDAPRHRHRKKSGLPAISMCFDIEGERIITTRHPEMFEFPLRSAASSDSWSLSTVDDGTTPSPTRSAVGSEVEEREEVPNTGAGGSYPGTSNAELLPQLRGLHCGAHDQGPALRELHQNVTEYIRDELQHMDASSREQALWMPTVSDAIANRVVLEERLLAMSEVEIKNSNEFLVTKTISNSEVWRDLEAWRPSVEQEYKQLVHEKGAVRQMTMKELQQLSQQKGVPIELLPGKTVHTRKAQTGAYRSRAVIGGNYAASTDQEVYAGGSDCTQVRTALKTSAVKGWCVMGTNVRTAFLNAKRRDESKLVAMSIPSIFKRLGLAGEEDVWVVEMALYGLTTSPRDWSIHRDLTLKELTWKRTSEDGRELEGHFERTQDDNLWRLMETDGQGHQWGGLLCVYVDDLLFCGEEPVLKSALQAVESQWSCAEAEWASDKKALKFCGIEITMDKDGNGLHLAQSGYEREMLERWQVSHGVEFPHIKLNETDFEQVEDINPKVLREAQALAGGLLWLATKTRPDLAYGVSAMSRLMTRNPQKALEVGNVLLNYIKANPGDLHYFKHFTNDGWGERSQLKAQRSQHSIEVFSDIAYAAGSGHRSVQGIAVFFSGSPVAWQSSQQPFVTHSTAEAELVSYCESLIIGRATEALLCTMWGVTLDKKNPFTRTLYGDNLAAIGLASGNTCSSWRTRHLRIRASILKKALEEDGEIPGGVWRLLHLKGTELVADGLTKPLLGQAFAKFMQDLGMKCGGGKASGPATEQFAALGNGEREAAVIAVMTGGLLLSGADAAPGEEGDAESNIPWMCGAILMTLGSIYLTQLTYSGMRCCVKRLRTFLHPKDEDKHWILCKESETDDEAVVITLNESAGASSSSMTQSMPSRSGSHVRKRGTTSSMPSSAAAGPMTSSSATTSGSAAAASISSSTTSASGLAAAASEREERPVGSVGASQKASAPKASAPKNPFGAGKT